MQIVTVHEAKTHLSRLLARVRAGEEIIIAKGKEPQAKLVPIAPEVKRPRLAGTLGPISDEEAEEAARPLPKEYWGYIGDDEG
jgi:prevent-host-death family protein